MSEIIWHILVCHEIKCRTTKENTKNSRGWSKEIERGIASCYNLCCHLSKDASEGDICTEIIWTKMIEAGD